MSRFLPPQESVGVQKGAEVLPGLERAHEEHVARRVPGALAAPGGPARRTRRRHHDVLAGNGQRLNDPLRRVLGRGEDAVGAPCVRLHERRVIAPDLGAGALGVIEEVQIVNRHDSRPEGRNEQGMRRVNDVEPAADQPLDPGHTDPVPPPVQYPHRHPPVVHRNAGCVGSQLPVRPVFP